MENCNLTEKLDFGKICRLCSQQNSDGYVLFVVGSERKDELAKYICSVLDAECGNDDKLPKWLCRSCYLKARSTQQFLQLVEAGQAKLRSLNQSIGATEELHEHTREHPDKIGIQFDVPNPQLLKICKKPRKRKLKNSVTFGETLEHSKRQRRKPKRFLEEIEQETSEKSPLVIVTQGSEVDSSVFITSQPIAEVRSAAGTALGEFIEVDADIKENQPNPAQTFYICQYCQQGYPRRHTFLKHVETHKNCRYECTECLEGFQQKVDIVQHQQQTGHVGMGIVESLTEQRCEETSNRVGVNIAVDDNSDITTVDSVIKGDVRNSDLELLQDNNSLAEKVQKGASSKYACLQCENEFESPYAARRHYKLVHVGDRAFKCTLCPAAFKTRYNYGLHKKVHTGEKNFACSVCQKTFKTRHERKRHSTVHTGEKPYKCELCAKTFAVRYNLVTHKRIHTGERPYKCAVCEVRCRTASHMKKHQAMHLRAAQKKLSRTSGAADGDPKKFGNLSTTPLATESSIGMDAMGSNAPQSLHKINNFMKATDKIVLPSTPLIQKVEVLPTLADINQLAENSTEPAHQIHHHLAAAARGSSTLCKYRCTRCGKQFRQSSSLGKHLRTHTGERPYKCPLCPKAFSDPSNFKKHKTLHKNATYALKSAHSSSMEELRQMLAEQSVAITSDAAGSSPPYSVSDPDPDGLEVLARLNTRRSGFSLSPSGSDFDEADGIDNGSLSSALQSALAMNRFDQALYSTKGGSVTASDTDNRLICISYEDPANPFDKKKTTFYMIN